MDCAHALILFEPLDLIARYAKMLAELVPDHDGEVAKRVGKSRPAVQARRVKLGIPPG